MGPHVRSRVGPGWQPLIAVVAIALCVPRVAEASRLTFGLGAAGRVHEVVPQLAGVPRRTLLVYGPGLELAWDLRIDRFELGGRVRAIGLWPSHVEGYGGVSARFFPVEWGSVSPFVGAGGGLSVGTECTSDLCMFLSPYGAVEVGARRAVTERIDAALWLSATVLNPQPDSVRVMPALWFGISVH